MIYGSVCSGIEAATQAWHPLGWSSAFFSEIDRFPSQVLAHHYGANMPGEELTANGVPNLGDMTKFKEWPDYAIDLLVGGTPCQSFSVAGLRQGLADPRGNLMLTYLAIARRYQPRWLVWENVPGVLSSNGGRDFGTFIRGLEECGYHAAWRVLDAQYVRVDGYGRAVPQRRRRVFVVGYLGDWRRAAAVLFEREGMSGNSAPRRSSQKSIARDVAPSLRAQSNCSLRDDSDAYVAEVAPCLDANYGRLQGHDNQHIDGGAGLFVAGAICKDSFTGGAGGRPEGAAAGHFIPIAFDSKASGRSGFGVGEISPTLRAMNSRTGNQNAGCQVAVQSGWAVRRLTPTECERLQGFPDGYTNIPVGKKMAADGPRYKALGNSMAINCMRWIGRRVEMVETFHARKAEGEAAA